MQIMFEMMTKWLNHSGLNVNKKKSSVYAKKLIIHNHIDVTLNNVYIRSKTTINFMGIQLDS